MIVCYEIERENYCFCPNTVSLSQKTSSNSVGVPLHSTTKIIFKLILQYRLCLLERAEFLLVAMGLDKAVRPLETIDE